MIKINYSHYDFSSDDELEEDVAVSVEVSASTDTEEKINRTIEQMKRELDTDNSDTDNYESLASEDNLTSVSSMDQYASCETLGKLTFTHLQQTQKQTID